MIDNIGAEPSTYRVVKYVPRKGGTTSIHAVMAPETEERVLIGVDFFVHWLGKDIATLGTILNELSTPALTLKLISCKGLKVWPDTVTEMDVTDRYRARFSPAEKGGKVTLKDVANLVSMAADKGVDFLKFETLYTFDGKDGFSATQGD